MKTHLLLAIVGVLLLSPSDSPPRLTDLMTVIVAQVSMPNLSDAVPTTTIFTPETAGLFRISAYVEAPPSANSGSVSANFTYTDDTGVQSSLGLVQSPTPLSGGSSQGTTVFRCHAYKSVAFETSGNFPCSGPCYSVHLTIERLDHQ